jgi:hypothetical protein
MKHLINKPKNSHKWIAAFFLAIFLPTIIPQQLYAANNGPNAPEAASFEPVDASDMVSLATGDMAYSLPILDVPSPEGGYPLVLAYHGGIGFDQESSMVGLGWNLNPGAINRNVNGAPDDWMNAIIKDRTRFTLNSKSNDLSTGYGYGGVEASIGYSWDSNGTKKGSLDIGYKRGSLSIGGGVGYSNKNGWDGHVSAKVAGIGVGVGYSEEQKWTANIIAGYGSENGFGVGVYANTDGLISIGVKHVASNTSLSLTSNKGKVGVGLASQGTTLFNSQSGFSSSSSWGCSVGVYFYGFFTKFGHNETSFKRESDDENHIYGPLYFSALSSGIHAYYDPHISYPGGFANQHNRDFYMDAYSQPVSEGFNGAVALSTEFDSEKVAYNAPSYDMYEVNAQGLSGRMSPRLGENGLIINPGVDLEYKETASTIPSCAGDTCQYFPWQPAPCADGQLGFKVSTYRKYVNSHYSTDSDQKFTRTFGEVNNGMPVNNINFYFDYQFPSDFKVQSIPLQPHLGATKLEDYFTTTYAAPTGRQQNSDFIETFTNAQIATATANGRFLEAKDYDRTNDQGTRPNGIGGYKITTSDGKTYYYSRPVYQFEEIYRQLASDGEGGSHPEYEGNYREIRKTEPYATHWLLTAITGPDFVKNSATPYPSNEDYGYWVRFDYGKWTDGYVWRSPYAGYIDTNPLLTTKNEEYTWGRKQLVYLDKIVTRTHTALFVKSLRKDDVGVQIGSPNGGGYISNEHDTDLYYPSQKTLKLDEIILLKNSEFNNSVNTDTQVNNLTDELQWATTMWVSPTPHVVSYGINQQNQVLDDGDFEHDSAGNLTIYNDAIKIIKLNNDSYDLAKGSPNSFSSRNGRLTLDSVESLGKGGDSYMPAYSFEYLEKDTQYTMDESVKDEWGYKKHNPMLWTLNKIHTPTGATIEFEYEEDEFYTEAFSRRIFDEYQLMFALFDSNGSWQIAFENHPALPIEDRIDFTQFFSVGNTVTWGSLYCCHDEANSGDADRITIPPQPLIVTAVSPTALILNFGTFQNYTGPYNQITGGWIWSGQDRSIVGSGCYGDDPGHSSTTFNFKLIANRTPQSGFGGGIRVAKISGVSETGEKKSTIYNYNDPTHNRTSGITTYAPSNGVKYIAYRTEIPGPRVMYEYVTLTDQGINNDYSGSTQYQFDVVHPVLDLFNEYVIEEGEHFKATVYYPPNVPHALDIGVSGAQIQLEDNFATVGCIKKVTQINKAGQTMSQIKNEFMTLDELANPLIKKPGALQESFHSMKSIYSYEKKWMKGNAGPNEIHWTETCNGSESINLVRRIATSSSKITYPMVQKRRIEIRGNTTQITEFNTIDPKSGMFLASETKLADGTTIRNEKTPAYYKYPEMGSKVDNIDFKNMLTQEAMNKITILKNAKWKMLDYNLTTWKKEWSYRDEIAGADTNPNSERDVWRKNKSYRWKENVLDSDGTYIWLDDKKDYFDWATGLPLVDNWQKTGEISRYNHYSAPIESKDINENFASSKMGDNHTKVIVSGDARYTEMFYSGAEYVNQGNIFDGEVKGADFRTNLIAHTGKYSVRGGVGDKVFEVTGSSGASDYYSSSSASAAYSKDFRPGKYKVSFWMYVDGNCSECRPSIPKPDDDNVPSILTVNDNPVKLAEIVEAGCWQQLNYYFDIPANRGQNTIVVSPLHASESNYFDDFRMHPIASTVKTYVYDDSTDELSCMLNSSNMGTVYRYDSAGRLIATYTENVNSAAISGGFRLTGQTKQSYVNKNVVAPNMPIKIENCTVNSGAMDFTIETKEANSFNNQFKISTKGGSGNYEYQYKHLINSYSNLYSGFTYGNDEVTIPYVPNFCQLNENGSGIYAKQWNFIAKVRDLTTNEIVEKTYKYKGECDNNIAYSIEPDIEISKNDACVQEKYAFQIHLKNIGASGNFKYEYAYYNPGSPFNSQILEWNDTDNKGNFCPISSKVADSKCETGYRKAVYFTYRITNLTTGLISDYYPSVFFGDCAQSGGNNIIIQANSEDENYKDEGMLIVKFVDGKISSFKNIL